MREDDNNHGPMLREVRTRRDRRRYWLEEGQHGFLRSLADVGGLGWLIVLPTLIGVFLGRWLDRVFETGIQLTAALLVLGLAIGCRLAWKRMREP